MMLEIVSEETARRIASALETQNVVLAQIADTLKGVNNGD